MSTSKVGGLVAVAVTALAISGTAYGDPGKNGPPGPQGNPNQPAAQPQANGPQGPAGNSSQGQSGTASTQHVAKAKTHTSHGKSDAKHGKGEASHGKSVARTTEPSAKSHANPAPGTPRKGGRADRPAGKITICHATKSVTHPYVEITISVNGLNGHGPADDPHHHEGSWKDIIPAPAGGCPSTVSSSLQKPGTTGTSTPTSQTGTTPTSQTGTTTTPESGVAPATDVAATAPAAATTPAEQAVLGARASGGSTPAAKAAPESKVLGASASGGSTPPAATLAAHAEGDSHGSLPFTGFELGIVLVLAAAALLGGFALRRATASNRI